MSKTLFCIQMSRTLIVLLTLIFIILSQLQVFHFTIIPWPTYHSTVAIILDLVLVIGLIASLTQHLKTLIFFSWLSALTFLLIFFGNTVSSQYQSDLIGMFYLLLICILAFTDAVCIIKYRMPSEEAHHPFMKCSQQQLFEQAADSLLVPLAVPAHHMVHHLHHHHHQQQQQPLPPPPPAPAPSSSSQSHHAQAHGHVPQPGPGPFHPATSGSSGSAAAMIASPSSPLPPPLPLNSHCYVSKNDPQFHAV